MLGQRQEVDSGEAESREEPQRERNRARPANLLQRLPAIAVVTGSRYCKNHQHVTLKINGIAVNNEIGYPSAKNKFGRAGFTNTVIVNSGPPIPYGKERSPPPVTSVSLAAAAVYDRELN